MREIEEYIGRQLEWVPERGDSWHAAHAVLKRGKTNYNGYVGVWNLEDSVLGLLIRVMLGEKQDHTDAYQAASRGGWRILHYLLSYPDIDQAFAPRLGRRPTMGSDTSRAEGLLDSGIRSGCPEVVRILLSYPRTRELVRSDNVSLMNALLCEHGPVSSYIEIIQLLLAEGVCLNTGWLVRSAHLGHDEMFEWMRRRPEIDVTGLEVLESVVRSERVGRMQRLLLDPRVDTLKAGTRALELACQLYSRFVPTEECFKHVLRAPYKRAMSHVLGLLFGDVCLDTRSKCKAMLKWTETHESDALAFLGTAREDFSRGAFLEYVCSLERGVDSRRRALDEARRAAIARL